MPGELKPRAKCPLCKVPLVALVDETTRRRVKRTYYHDKDPEASTRARRPLPCKQTFTNFAKASRERRALEV